MTTEPQSTTEPTWRSDKAHEVICDAAERIANAYCTEDDTYSLEVRRLTVAISDVVDSRVSAPTVAPEVDAWAIAQKVIADWHDYEKWHDPSMLPIPAFSGAQEQELTRLIAEAIRSATATPRSEAGSVAGTVDNQPHCWHCGVVLEAVELKLRCDQCPADCDDELCSAFGCAPQGTAAASTVAPVEQSDAEPTALDMYTVLNDSYRALSSLPKDCLGRDPAGYYYRDELITNISRVLFSGALDEPKKAEGGNDSM